MKNTNHGTLRRGLRLGKLGLSLTGSYLSYQAQNLFLGERSKAERQSRFQRQASHQIRKELGSLKGAVMKLGQILSTQTQFLPESVIDELSHLQMQAPPMHAWLSRAQFKAALGRYPEEAFARFDPEPFAAASLGQVHLGLTHKGEKVAIKIQYPAIRSAIENDFKLLRSATLPARITGHLPKEVIGEIERGFLEETDYLHEASNIEFFAEGLRRLDFVTVPKVFREFTGSRVLTMSFIEGEPAARFIHRRHPAKVCDLIGDRLLTLYYFQLHRLRALHADHHPGNYLLQDNGRIGLVDFGCVKRISFDASELIRGCAAQVWRNGEKDAERILRFVFGEHIPFARAKRMLRVLDKMASVLYPNNGAPDQWVDFGKAEPLKVLTEALKQAITDKIVNPDFAFVSRAELGLMNLLHSLRANVSPANVWRRVDI